MKLDIPELPMTVEQFEDLPEVDGARFELVDGNLIVMNAFYAVWHAEMILRMTNVLRANGLVAYSERGIRLGKRTWRSADLGVFKKVPQDFRQATHDPIELSHLIEVVSPESRERDYAEKPREYAAAGVPEYWIVDEHPDDMLDGIVRMHRLVLDGNEYKYFQHRQATVKQLEAEGL